MIMLTFIRQFSQFHGFCSNIDVSVFAVHDEPWQCNDTLLGPAIDGVNPRFAQEIVSSEAPPKDKSVTIAVGVAVPLLIIAIVIIVIVVSNVKRSLFYCKCSNFKIPG